MAKEKATYISVWDDGTPIETSCEFDRETNTASNIESADVSEEDIDVLTDEFVLLSDGTEIRAFYNEDTDTLHTVV
jgi:hypothetical protein